MTRLAATALLACALLVPTAGPVIQLTPEALMQGIADGTSSSRA